MSVFSGFENFVESTHEKLVAAFHEAIPHITRAMQASEGEFPISAKQANAVRIEVGKRDPSIRDIVASICGDPFLALRIVSLVNYPIYTRGRPTENVTGALNLLGFNKLSEAMRDLCEEKDFNKVFAGRAIAHDVLAQILLAAKISVKIVNHIAPKRNISEEALIVCVLSNIPLLTTAYYYPGIYAALRLDSLHSKADFERTLKRRCKIEMQELCREVSSCMSLPQRFSNLMALLSVSPWNRRLWSVEEQELRPLVIAIYFANAISEAIFRCEDGRSFRTMLRDVVSKLDLDIDSIFSIMTEIPAELSESLTALGLDKVYLPEYMQRLAAKGELIDQPDNKKIRHERSDIKSFLIEIRACLKAPISIGEYGRAGQAVYCTLLGLVKVLGFSKAIFLTTESGKQILTIGAEFGISHPIMANSPRSLTARFPENMPDVMAWVKQKAIFTGDPLFGDDWPFAAFPVVQAGQSVGVFYADRASNTKAQSLNTDEQMAVIALAEEWLHAPSNFR